MDPDKLHDYVLELMEHTVHKLAARITAPKLMLFAKVAEGFRYEEKGPPQAIVQKLARLVSLLRAARLLHTHGFLQEQAAICRLVDEAQEDIFFLAQGVVFGTTELHTRFLEAFYLEEFEDASQPMQTRVRRPNIPRDKIQAYLTAMSNSKMDPSTGKAAMASIHKIASGFVHGASPFVMEMYCGHPLAYQMNGLLGTPQWFDHRDDLWNYINRAIMSFCAAAKAFGDDALAEEILNFSRDFEKTEPK